MTRRLVAGLIVVGLAIGVWFLWPRDDTEPTPTTVPAAVDSSTSTSTMTTLVTTTSAGGTTSSAESHVVTTVEEAEAILQELWFGWFEGIYNEDEERIKEVVATQSMLDAARDAFGSMAFQAPPTIQEVRTSGTEILRSDESCTAAYATLDVSEFLGPDSTESSVYVLRRVENHWALATIWISPDDLWDQDCDSQLEPLS